GVRGAYVDEIRVRLAENQPQKQVQKDSESTFFCPPVFSIPFSPPSIRSLVHFSKATAHFILFKKNVPFRIKFTRQNYPFG
ncbi:hypothetical protein, partial [Clostridium fessum]|uniref:hypothetical protein n=1 Tax=Clostridium fessum TaxID=2126740 RepID=UPI0032C16B3D